MEVIVYCNLDSWHKYCHETTQSDQGRKYKCILHLSSAQLWWSSRYLKVNQHVFYTSKYKQYSQRRFTRVQDCKFDSKNKITSFLRIFGLHGLVTLTAPLALLGLLSVSHVYMGIRISIPALLMEELNIFRLKLK